jgi:hypothetical protein|nr:hypothetical protein [Kofleriaceae bacterium]
MKLRSVALALVVAGCGGDPSISDLFHDEVSNVCHRVFDCKDQYDASMHTGETFEDYAGGSTVDECVTNADGFLGSAADEAQAAVDAKRVKYDGAQAQKCLDAFDAETCDEVLEQNGQTEITPTACAGVFTGLVATGGSCTEDIDCASDDGCDGAPMTCGGGDGSAR